jgi:hypothetical protein
MNRSHREPTLGEILSDSIVRALMEADGATAGPRGDAAADRPEAGPASGSIGSAVDAGSLPSQSITSLRTDSVSRFPGRGPYQINSAGRRLATRKGVPISKHHEAQLRGLRHRFGPTIGIKLGEYRSDMKLGGVERNTQATGNRFV